MKTHVRLFASYREQAGGDHYDLALDDGATVAAAVASLLEAAPSLPRDFKPHLIAVNEEFANLDYPLHDGDEVALYPPVSGGIDARMVSETIDIDQLADAVRRPGNGAVVTFEGTTRDNTGGRRVLRLEYEAHVPMAEKVLAHVLNETAVRFGLDDIAVRHRIGMLEIGEVSLVVAVAAPHRMEAFLAAQYAVDRIKHVVPVWKREFFEDGEVWVGKACDPVTHANHLAEAPYAGFLAAAGAGHQHR
jgi:molybdopterin synthase catalytic subunit